MYMKDASNQFAYEPRESEFKNVFAKLAEVFPTGIRRPGREGMTPLNLYEGVAVGAALALKRKDYLNIDGIEDWMHSEELRKFTTGATNNRQAVRGRIELCRDRFLGEAYVPGTER